MYAFLASRIAGFSFGCLNEFDQLPSLHQRVPWWVAFPISLTFALSLVASIFCGLYATCVFALCSLYSKTALAEQKDSRMRTFLLERSRVINPPEGEANYHVSASIRPRRPPIPQAFASRQLAS